jgi:hypothetical protein
MSSPGAQEEYWMMWSPLASRLIGNLRDRTNTEADLQIPGLAFPLFGSPAEWDEKSDRPIKLSLSQRGNDKI